MYVQYNIDATAAYCTTKITPAANYHVGSPGDPPAAVAGGFPGLLRRKEAG